MTNGETMTVGKVSFEAMAAEWGDFHEEHLKTDPVPKGAITVKQYADVFGVSVSTANCCLLRKERLGEVTSQMIRIQTGHKTMPVKHYLRARPAKLGANGCAV